MQFRPAKLVQLFIIRRYRRYPVRTLQFVFEQKFSELMSDAQMQPFNLPPNAPPEAPSYQMTDGKRILQVSDLQVGLTLNFETAAKSLNPVPKLLDRPARIFDHAVDTTFEKQIDFFTGITVVLNYPADDVESAAAFLTKSMSQYQPPGKSISFQQIVAWQNESTFFNIETSVYQKFNFVGMAGQPTHYDLEFEVPAEVGIQAKIDVNSRPLRGTQRTMEATNMIADVETALNEILPRIANGELRV